MLRVEDSERLVRVGPDTPAGKLFRRYWQPALLSSEVSANDGAPVRVRLLGEDLIAFRDTNGAVGLVDAYCPHRRAPMFFGRNEDCGLRCVYHGWKFDVTGRCVDLPTEPAASKMKDHIRIAAYPTVERGGIVWTYMGPREFMPAPPDYEWLRAPETHRAVSKSREHCNYLQALEGGLDTAHVSFLHNESVGRASINRDGAPQIEVHDTDYGYFYTSTRQLDDAQNYVRLYQYVMPAQQFRPTILQASGSNHQVPRLSGHIWVPIDDLHTHVYNWMYGYDADARLDPDYVEREEHRMGHGKEDYIENSFRLKASTLDDYGIDRALQKSGNFTGIRGINTQDMALQEGMGLIVDRTKEHLGSSDKAIIAMRNALLNATRKLEQGEAPKGTDPATYRAARAHEGFVPSNESWRNAFAEPMRPRW